MPHAQGQDRVSAAFVAVFAVFVLALVVLAVLAVRWGVVRDRERRTRVSSPGPLPGVPSGGDRPTRSDVTGEWR